ncbi:MAG: ribosome recycling factor [Coriobacteriia bacterium]|nr:ribosome recycling factor [Coriobacteriia bacterium]
MSEITDQAKAQMEKSLEALANNFLKIRTGRANANTLADIKVDYYGVETPVTQLAGIKTPEAHLLVIEPWDKSSLSAIEKAILNSDLGITPNNDGNAIRLPFPSPTEERRRELVKESSALAEDAKVSVRNIRRDANNKLDRAEKDGDISEDITHREKDVVQKLTDTYVEKIDEMLKEKEAEVMEI